MNIPINKNKTYMPIQKCISGMSVSELSDVELLAVIIGTGTKKVDVMETAALLIKNHGGIYDVSRSGLREIAERTGIGLTKAVKIQAAFELGKRVITDNTGLKRLDSPEKVWQMLLPEMAGLRKEEFRVLVLNNKNMLIRKSVVSIGTISETIVHPREVFREAIRENGASIIVAHNHPSGEVAPSKDDIITTRRLSETGKLIGIPLLDHVIICNSKYYSMKEEGYLD